MYEQGKLSAIENVSMQAVPDHLKIRTVEFIEFFFRQLRQSFTGGVSGSVFIAS